MEKLDVNDVLLTKDSNILVITNVETRIYQELDDEVNKTAYYYDFKYLDVNHEHSEIKKVPHESLEQYFSYDEFTVIKGHKVQELLKILYF